MGVEKSLFPFPIEILKKAWYNEFINQGKKAKWNSTRNYRN